MIATLIAISLLTVTRVPVASNPDGIWVLNKAKSDFGAAEAPRQFIVRLEETENLLSILTMIVDAGGQRVSFRQYRLPDQPTPQTNLLPVNSDPQRNEEWQVTAQGELVITRVVVRRSRLIPQRLVFDRSTPVE